MLCLGDLGHSCGFGLTRCLALSGFGVGVVEGSGAGHNRGGEVGRPVKDHIRVGQSCGLQSAIAAASLPCIPLRRAAFAATMARAPVDRWRRAMLTASAYPAGSSPSYLVAVTSIPAS